MRAVFDTQRVRPDAELALDHEVPLDHPLHREGIERRDEVGLARAMVAIEARSSFMSSNVQTRGRLAQGP